MGRVHRSDRHRRAFPARGRGEEGFTLIELLVVVVIIGVLSAIAIPVILGQRAGARVAAVESDLHNMAAALIAHGTVTGGNASSAVVGPNVAGTQISAGGPTANLSPQVPFRGTSGVDIYLGSPLTTTMCLVGHATEVDQWVTFAGDPTEFRLIESGDLASASAVC